MAHEKQGSEPGTEVEMEQAIELWAPVPLLTPPGAFCSGCRHLGSTAL